MGAESFDNERKKTKDKDNDSKHHLKFRQRHGYKNNISVLKESRKDDKAEENDETNRTAGNNMEDNDDIEKVNNKDTNTAITLTTDMEGNEKTETVLKCGPTEDQ